MIGFACDWWFPRERTWSFIPARLLDAFDQAAPGQVVDMEAEVGVAQRAALVGLGKLTPAVPWKYTRAYLRTLDRKVHRRIRQMRVEAVLEIADLVVPSAAPTFVYQDMNFDVAATYAPQIGYDKVSTFPTSLDVLERLASRQVERYADVSGVIAASHWFKEWLVEHNGLDSSHVHVVPFGINHPPPESREHVEPECARLLFVGAEFQRKGGDLLLQAAERARREIPELELTICSSSAPADLPDWVDSTGPISNEVVGSLYTKHDLFVLPSRFEAYGIAFLEARAAGLPCIGTDQMAMPELVPPEAGIVVPPGEVEPLAAAIVEALGDRDLRQRAIDDAPVVRERWSWRRAALDLLDVISG